MLKGQIQVQHGEIKKTEGFLTILPWEKERLWDPILDNEMFVEAKEELNWRGSFCFVLFVCLRDRSERLLDFWLQLVPIPSPYPYLEHVFEVHKYSNHFMTTRVKKPWNKFWWKRNIEQFGSMIIFLKDYTSPGFPFPEFLLYEISKP